MRIVAHGKLRALMPEPIEIEVATVAEAMEALGHVVPGFRPTVGKGRECVQIVGVDTMGDLFDPTDREEIHLVPPFMGARGAVQIVLGAVLVAISFIPGIGTATAAFIFNAGLAMIAGGIIALFSPAPSSDHGGVSNDKSRYLGTPKNTVAIGTRIPIVYGRHRVYGHFLAFDIDSDQTVLLP